MKYALFYSFDVHYEIMVGEVINIADRVHANDNCDGDISDQVKIETNFDFNVPGVYTISLEVTDSSFNTAVKEAKIQVCALHEIGDELELNNWQFSIKNYYFTSSIEDKGTWDKVLYHSYTAAEGQIYLVLEATLKNTGKGQDSFANTPGFSIVPSDEQTNEIVYYQEKMELLTRYYEDPLAIEPWNHLTMGNDLRNYNLIMVDGGEIVSGRFYFLIQDSIQDNGESLMLRFESLKNLIPSRKGYVFYVTLRP